MLNVAERVAGAILDIGAVGFNFKTPITFKSGIKSPVYVDNRRLISNPDQWQQVIRAFIGLVGERGNGFDVIAGIETAGIPHSSVLGYELKIPSVIVRKAAKDHGTKKMIDGGDVSGKRVLLIEDHVTTGGSSLHGVHELRQAGAEVTDLFAITSYEFAESAKEFEEEGINLFTLTTFSIILKEALKRQLLNEEQVESVHDWLHDPHGWASRHGFNQ